jgi:hypothetical protein
MATLSKSIREMGPGDFWAHPTSLGLSDADVALIDLPPECCPPEVRDRMLAAAIDAFHILTNAEIEGKPS